MKRFLVFFFLLFSSLVFAQNVPVPDRPSPPRLVNDFAHVLTPDQIESLERKLVAYDDSTSTQIVVITVETLGDYDISDYALSILRKWGVGNKKTNNGIVLLAAIKDRKVRIETGYGLEGAIPDITAKQIIENHIVPNFQNGNNYYRGFDEATDALVKAATGEYKAPENYHKQATPSRKGGGLPFIAIIIILIIIFSRRGGGGGGMMSRRGFNPFLGGLLGGFIGGRASGGGWSSGGGGFGGGGGGGFGGFGGGSGGGGGASGSW